MKMKETVERFYATVKSLCETLKAVIREFQIGKADERVDALLTFAKVVSFTDDGEQAKQLFAELLG